MALPNMAMIPSGYKPTKLYSVLPTPTYGSEEVLNGNFATDSDWIKGAGWTISGGVCVGTSVAISVAVYQTPLIIGKKYRITVDLVSVISGGIKERIGTSSNPIERTTAGTYSFERVADSTVLGVIAGSNGFTGTIDNVSVKEVLVGDADFDVLRATPATRVNQQGLIETPEFILSGELVTNGDFSDGGTDWILGSGWTIEENKATQDNSTPNTGDIIQTNVSVVGKQYKITFDLDVTSGTVSALIGGHNLFNTSGTKTFFKTANATNFAFRNYANFIGSIDNVSIVEVERENIPRLDYTDGGCPVLLTEPQSTNLVKDSEDFTQGSWIHNSNLGITPNTTISPDGTQNADSLVYSGSGNRLGVDIAMTINTKYALSIYYKNNGGNNQIPFSGSNTTGATTVTITDEWARYTVIFTATATATSNLRFMSGMANANLFAWGAQIEELDYATSYMPTYGEIASRAGETVSNAGDANTFNSEGVLFAEISTNTDGTDKAISISDGTTDNRIWIAYSTVNKRIFALGYTGNVIQFNFNKIVSDESAFAKVAVKYKDNDFSLWIDGVREGVDTGGTVPTNLSSLQFDLGNGNGNFYGKTKQVQVFNTALSDFELKLLTSQDTNYNSYEAMRLALNYNIQ